ncbi:hypothetical protein Tco_0754260, partial [Tanacetum coccineum]
EARQDDEVNKEDSFDPRVQTPSRVESISDEDNDDEIQGGNVQGTKLNEEATNKEEVGNELYKDVNVNLAGQDTEMTDAPQTNVQTTQVIKDSHVTSLVDVPVTTIVETSFLVTIILPPPPNALITQMQQTPAPTPTNVPSSSLQDLPNFGSLQQFNYSLKDLEKKLKRKTKNSSIRSMPLVNDQLESEVLIRSSKEANTSHVVNLYKALVDAYEADKNILDTYVDTVTFKRRRDDADDDEEPSAGSNWGSKRRRFRKEPESTSAPKEKTSKSTGSSKEGPKSKTRSTNKSAYVEEPVYTVDDLEQPAHQEFNTGFTENQ